MFKKKLYTRITAGTILAISVLVMNSAGADSTNIAIPHPDGTLGQLNFALSGQYLSVSSDLNIPLQDDQSLGINLVLPVLSNLTINGGYRIEPDDTLFHNPGIGLKFYSRPTSPDNHRINPDGSVGAPIFAIMGEARIKDNDPDDMKYRIFGEIIYPISSKLTIGAGVIYIEEDNPYQVDNFFGLISWYPVEYEPGQQYENADGRLGYPTFTLLAGGSKNGTFGQLKIILPMSPRYSLFASIHGEKIDDFKITKTGLGAGISYYPGEN